MLIGNGLLINKVPLTLLGDRWNAFVRDERVASRCFDGFGDKSALPSGYGVGKAIWPAVTAGGLNSHRYSVGTSTATLSMASGRNVVGLSEGTSTANATLQLVVSMQGTATGTSTAEGNVNAALAMAGSSAGTCTVSSTIGAIAWAYGAAEGSSTATLTSYATGRLYGSITPYTELSPQTLASAVMAAAETTPIHSDIRKVNSYTVTGDGTASSTWGPA